MREQVAVSKELMLKEQFVIINSFKGSAIESPYDKTCTPAHWGRSVGNVSQRARVSVTTSRF